MALWINKLSCPPHPFLKQTPAPLPAPLPASLLARVTTDLPANLCACPFSLLRDSPFSACLPTNLPSYSPARRALLGM